MFSSATPVLTSCSSGVESTTVASSRFHWEKEISQGKESLAAFFTSSLRALGNESCIILGKTSLIIDEMVVLKDSSNEVNSASV